MHGKERERKTFFHNFINDQYTYPSVKGTTKCKNMSGHILFNFMTRTEPVLNMFFHFCWPIKYNGIKDLNLPVMPKFSTTIK